MKSTIAIIALLAASTGAARAADAPSPSPPPPSGETVLHLGVVGTVQETPDLLSADLGGTAMSADPASAQRQLDARMKTATTAAAAVRGVDWRVAGYGVDQTMPDGKTRPVWTAHQTLHLQSADADGLLALVGRLQSDGLAVESLQWVLSPARQQAAEARATAAGLKLLRQRAAEAAAALDLHVRSIRSVSLGGSGGPRPMPMMRMMAAGPVAPQASRSDADVSQDVEGEIVLAP